MKTSAVERVKAAAALLAKIEPTDVSFLLGLALLYDGLWRTFGVGVANVVVGVILVATPLILILRSQPTKKV